MSADVVDFPGISYLDLPVEKILSKAQEQGLEGAVVIGWDKEGEFYFASSYADGPEVLWLLELTKRRLFESADEIAEDA